MAVDLLTNIKIGWQQSGLDGIAAAIQDFGSQVDQLGAKVRDFEKDSVNVYRSYEDNMLAARYALSAQYTSATELDRVMALLEGHANEWAANSIFHTSDVSKAINEAAHAGWNYEQILAGIPQAMLIAQAGGMDLSQGLDFLVEMMNTTGTSFDDMGTIVDQWAKAANVSATDIGELGEAFMSLSASAMFADNTQELFGMLAVLANAGVTGTKAGTLLRTAMMRMVAPTKKAQDAMAGLGMTAEEYTQWMSEYEGPELSLAEQLEMQGFSAFDAAGKLKPFKEILVSLHDSLSGMTEMKRYDILASIFPIRSINAATAFYNAIESGSMEEIFAAIGDSEGYAQKGADIMMSGLTGSIELLLSKWEEFQRSVGAELAPTVQTVADSLGGVVDFLNGLDEVQMAGLVSGMTTLSTLGPGLLITGAAIKFFGTLGPVGTTLLLLAVGAGALGGAMSALKEIQFRENFGTMGVDLDELGNHVDSLKTKFDGQKTAISEWEAALEGAQSKYKSLSIQFSELMMTDVLEGKTLSDADKRKLFSYGESITQAALDGIKAGKSSDRTFLQALLGDNTEPEADDLLNTADNVVSQYYDNLYAEAYEIGAQIRRQMTAALQDENLDESERLAIQASVDRLNEINAQIASTLDQEGYYAELFRSQRISWDSAAGYFDQLSEKQAQDMASLEDTYAQKYGHYRSAFEYAAANGTQFKDLQGNMRTVTAEDWAEFDAAFQAEYEQARQSVTDKYSDLTWRAVESLMNDSVAGKGIAFIREAAQSGVDITKAFNPDGTMSVDFARLWSKHAPTQEEAAELYTSLTKFSEIWGRLNREFPDIIGPLDSGPLAYMMSYLENPQSIYAVEATIQELRDNFNKAWPTDWGEVQGPPALTVETELDTSAVDNYIPSPKTLNVFTNLLTGKPPMMAEGGRATEPSILGDAGPEWAIPEQHSERTAELLNAAREASGFTWGDLLSRYGGLNANPGGQNVVVNYSPTINAQDAEGVDKVLAADKNRLLRMVRQAVAEQRTRDEVEVYA